MRLSGRQDVLFKTDSSMPWEAVISWRVSICLSMLAHGSVAEGARRQRSVQSSTPSCHRAHSNGGAKATEANAEKLQDGTYVRESPYAKKLKVASQCRRWNQRDSQCHFTRRRDEFPKRMHECSMGARQSESLKATSKQPDDSDPTFIRC